MAGTPTYISSATTTQVFIGAGELKSITVGETAAGAITVYDAASGTAATAVRAVLKASVAEQTYPYEMNLVNGCRIVTAAASKITVVTV